MHSIDMNTLTVTGTTDLAMRLTELAIADLPTEHSRRSYTTSLASFFSFVAGRSITRELILDWRRSMESLAASTINVRLSAVRKMVSEAVRHGILDAEQAAKINDVPNIPARGHRAGNWLTLEQTRAYLAVPTNTRDRAILALLVGCGLRRHELVSLQAGHIQSRDGRWVILDLKGKGNKLRTVAIPMWAYTALRAWMDDAEITSGPIFNIGTWSVWYIVTEAAKTLDMTVAPHDLRRTCAKLCRAKGGDIEQIKFLLGHSSIQTTERYLGTAQELTVAVNDNIF